MFVNYERTDKFPRANECWNCCFVLSRRRAFDFGEVTHEACFVVDPLGGDTGRAIIIAYSRRLASRSSLSPCSIHSVHTVDSSQSRQTLTNWPTDDNKYAALHAIINARATAFNLNRRLTDWTNDRPEIESASRLHASDRVLRPLRHTTTADVLNECKVLV